MPFIIAVEVLAAIAGAALAVGMAACLFVGILGVVGAVRIVRCDRCNHLGVTFVPQPLMNCARCRHERLLHPIHAVHQSANPSHVGR